MLIFVTKKVRSERLTLISLIKLIIYREHSSVFHYEDRNILHQRLQTRLEESSAGRQQLGSADVLERR